MSSIRLAYSSTFLCSFIVLSLYSAALISYLTVPMSNLPFSTLEGFVKDGSYQLIVTRDGSDYETFKNSNESIYKRMNKLMLPKNFLPVTVDDGFNMVCNDKVAFYDSEILDEISNNNISCKVMKILTGRFSSAGMMLRKRSPYKKIINNYLSKLRNFGILNRIKSRYFKKMVQFESDNFNIVGLHEIATLLVILLGGIILSVILLCLEKIYFKHRLHTLFIYE